MSKGLESKPSSVIHETEKWAMQLKNYKCIEQNGQWQEIASERQAGTDYARTSGPQ